MATIIGVRNLKPQLGERTWLAENATIIGDVKCGTDCSFWFQSVVRGDVGSIKMGDRVNVQDGVVIHSTFKKSEVIIGDDVSIGHRAIVHGCQIHNDVLIGMGAIVMDNAIIESGAIVAAGAVVLANTRVPAGSVFAGIPAKLVKMNDKEISGLSNKEIAKSYLMYKDWFSETEN